MSRSASPSIRNRLPLHALLLAATAFGIPSPAQAGIGNPLKKAKEAIAKPEKADPAPASVEPVVFDDVTLELTEERVTRIITAFKASTAAGSGRPAVVDKLNKLQDERGKIDEKHGEDIRELQRKRGDVEACYHDGYQEVRDRKTQEYSQKALTDPAIREKFARAAQENNAAAAKGDSAAIARINAVLYSEILPSSSDSAEVRKGCGPLPPISGPEAKMTALDKEIAAQTEQLRLIDDNVAKTQAKELKMNDQQAGMAFERIQNYRAWRGSGKSPAKSPTMDRAFTPEEIEALEKHLQELNAAFGS